MLPKIPDDSYHLPKYPIMRLFLPLMILFFQITAGDYHEEQKPSAAVSTASAITLSNFLSHPQGGDIFSRLLGPCRALFPGNGSLPTVILPISSFSSFQGLDPTVSWAEDWGLRQDENSPHFIFQSTLSPFAFNLFLPADTVPNQNRNWSVFRN